MKKIITGLVIAMMSFVASCADYKEGEQYTVVSSEISKNPEVREYFSFYCPHCYRFEPFFANVKKQLPAGVSFERNHVDFLRFTTPEIQGYLTRALVVAQQLNQEEKLVAAMFKYVHVQRGTFTSVKDVRNVFVLNGVDGEQFDKLFKSFEIKSQANRMKKHQEALAKKRMLTGVPAIVVNGKYRINNDALDRDNFEADYNNLVKHLLTLDK